MAPGSTDGRTDGASHPGFRPAELLALGGLAAFLCFVNLGSGSLRSWDEATYAQIARELWSSGDWLTPRMNGLPYFDKPPLTLWLMASGYSLIGVTELAVRLGSALTGVGSVLLIWDFARRAFSARAGLLAGLLLLATPHFLQFSKMGMTDVPLTFFITLSLYCYWRALRQPRWLLGAGAAFGMALMTKHAAAGIAPVAALAHVLAFRRFDLLRSRWLWLGGIAGIAIGLPWHIAMAWRWGRDFYEPYVEYHILSRGVRVLQGHPGGPFFYIGVLTQQYRPWFLLLPATLGYLALATWRRRDETLGLLACWIATVALLSLAIPTKLDWYLMPVYPALAAGNAAMLSELATRRSWWRPVLAGVLIVLATQLVTSPRILDLDYSPHARSFGEIVRRDAEPPVYVHGVSLPAIRFYSERPVQVLQLDELGDLARAGAYIITREALVGELRDTGVAFSQVASSNDRALLQLRSPGPD